MISLGTHGKGKNKIQFYWRESNLQYFTMTFKSETRTGIAILLKEFRQEQRALRHKQKWEELRKDSPIKFLAAKNPRCKITTRKKEKGLPIEKEYLFNWRINGHVTIQQMQRIIKRKGDKN